jgi:putative hydrolase of HD superfamily
VTINDQLCHTTSDEITTSYNDDRYNPVDGELVKAADDLAAFVKAYLAVRNGISNPQLQTAIREKRLGYRNKTLAGIDLSKVYEEFE